jgi:antirestriction protein
MEQEPRGAGPDTTGNEHEAHEALTQERPRIYAASLSDYNAGVLHGVWLDADQEIEDINQVVSTMLEMSPTDARAEEVAIHDYEYFGGYRVEEYDSLDWISRVARGISEHGPAFGAWADLCGHDQDMLDKFEDAYLGEWDSIEDYAEQIIDDFGLRRELDEHVPELLAGYVHIDIAGFARDMRAGLDISVVDNRRGGVWIFEGQV